MIMFVVAVKCNVLNYIIFLLSYKHLFETFICMLKFEIRDFWKDL